eukprot:m.59414 g.59414  ORF g.59414 m.59414 type:complete len:671 (-) comp7908_c0_seq3:267-2279(-)
MEKAGWLKDVMKFGRKSSQEDVVSGLCGELSLIVGAAKDLPTSSSGTAYDPYCVVHVVSPSNIHSKASRTGVRKKTNHPLWNDEIKIPTIMDGESIHFIVKHWIRLGKPKVIAEGILNLHDLLGGEKKTLTVTLEPQGSLDITILYEDNSDLFGLSLEDSCIREGCSIPYIITECVCEIEKRGCADVGLYRTAGNARIIRVLKNEFNQDPMHVKVGPDQAPKVSAVASLLKLYLRELPEQIFTEHLYDAFLSFASDLLTHEKRISGLQGTLTALPKSNYDSILFLLDHFHHISTFSDLNMMTTLNLSTCLGPSLFTPAGDVKSLNVHEQNVLTNFLLENWKDLKRGLEPPEIPPDVEMRLREIRLSHPKRTPSVASSYSTKATALSDKSESSLTVELAACMDEFDETQQLEKLKEALGMSDTLTPKQEEIINAKLLEIKSIKESVRIGRARTLVKSRKSSIAPPPAHLQFASALLATHAETKEDHLTPKEFRHLCYDLGVFIVDDNTFNKLSNGEEFLTRNQFQRWWWVAGERLAEIYSTYSKHRLFTQAVAYFQYYDLDRVGVIEGPSFMNLHQDLLNHSYANINDNVLDCYCEIKQKTQAELNGEPWSCTFNEFVDWLLRINAVSHGQSPSISLPPKSESGHGLSSLSKVAATSDSKRVNVSISNDEA